MSASLSECYPSLELSGSVPWYTWCNRVGLSWGLSDDDSFSFHLAWPVYVYSLRGIGPCWSTSAASLRRQLAIFTCARRLKARGTFGTRGVVAPAECATFDYRGCPSHHGRSRLGEQRKDGDRLLVSTTLVKRSLAGGNLACSVLA